MIDLERFSGIVAGIYDAGVNPDVWQDVVGSISSLLDSQQSALVVRDSRSRSRTKDLYASPGCDPAFGPRYDDYYRARHPVPDVEYDRGLFVSPRWVVGDRSYEESEYFRDFYAGFGLADSLSAYLLRDGDRTAELNLHRAAGAANWDRSDAAFLALLRPHLEKALRINGLLAEAEADRGMLERGLDRLAVGVIALDRERRPVYANGAAERFLRDNDGLAVRHGRLVLPDSATGPDADTLILRRPSGRLPYRIECLSLARDRGAGLPRAAVAVLFVTDPERRPGPPAVAWRELFGLTPAETRVAVALGEGRSPAEAMAMLGSGRNTLKTHRRRIYEKTGVSSQAALARLLRALS